MSSTSDHYGHSHETGSNYPYNSTVLLLAAVVLLSIVIFFVLLLHSYARWLLRRPPIIAHVVTEALTGYPGHADNTPFFAKGLDAKVVASLPEFVYKSNKHVNGMECVVCLSMMEEEEKGRILPRCSHMFHVACVDMWLVSHSTCPICRASVCDQDGLSLVADDAASSAIVSLEDGEVVGGNELVAIGGALEGGDVAIEMPIGSSTTAEVPCVLKGDESPPPRSSSWSSSSSSSSSLSCSLKKMVSKSRSERRVFPSVTVN